MEFDTATLDGLLVENEPNAFCDDDIKGFVILVPVELPNIFVDDSRFFSLVAPLLKANIG